MSPEEFHARLETITRRFNRVAQDAALSTEDAAEELQVTLEELRVADEELRRQNQELAEVQVQLEAERQRYRDLFDLAPDAYLVTDPHGVVTESNRSAARLFNTPSHFLSGKALAMYVARHDRARFRSVLGDLIHLSHCRSISLDLEPRQREPIAVELTCSLVRSVEGRVAAIRWIVRDISAQQRMANQIRALNRELERQVVDRTADLQVVRQRSDDLVRREQAAREAAQASEAQSRHVQKLESIGVLAGGIAHDFNNLLHVVLGNADIALSRLPPETSAREPLEEVVRATLRAADLTRQLLAYSGKGAFVVGHLDLSREVREMGTLLRTAISKRAILAWELVPDLPPVRADATQIRQVVMNLITNASDALGDSTGSITLRTGLLAPEEIGRDRFEPPATAANLEQHRTHGAGRERGPFVYLEVTDTGTGMTPETLSRIFDPFFSTKFSGRGLGLAAVMGIVRSHNGFVRIRTEPGRGTAFRVLFPAATGSALQHHLPAGGQLDWRGNGTVLVVDDEEGVREVLERMLQEVGYEAITAADGSQGLELLDRNKDRVVGVLLDLTMPQMSGEETLRRLRASYPRLPVIVMSGFSEEAVAAELVPSEGTEFLQKPFLAEDLIDTFRRVFQTSG